MKIYVIKNEEGKYQQIDVEKGIVGFVDTLDKAKIYPEEHVRKYGELDNKNLHWQEVTIAEGDLKNELSVYKKAISELHFNTAVISEILVSQSKKELTNAQTRDEIIKYMNKIDFIFDEVKDKLGVDVFIKLRKELGCDYNGR